MKSSQKKKHKCPVCMQIKSKLNFEIPSQPSQNSYNQENKW